MRRRDGVAKVRVGETEVLTLAEAAERLGVRRDTLVHQVRSGRMSATLSGNIYLVTAEEVARYDEQRKRGRGFAHPDHPLHGKRGGGGRRKKD